MKPQSIPTELQLEYLLSLKTKRSAPVSKTELHCSKTITHYAETLKSKSPGPVTATFNVFVPCYEYNRDL